MGQRQFSDEHVDAVLRHVNETISRDTKTWAEWPGGWPGEIGTALIDSVFSARATYKTKRGRGVHARVTAWQATADESRRSLSALRGEIEASGPEEWARRFGNEQHSPRRSATAPSGPTKAAAVLEVATVLSEASPRVDAAGDVTASNAGDVRRLMQSVSGVGYATSNYFSMLLGLPGVKPDRMVHRFLDDAMRQAGTEPGFTNATAEALVNAVAACLNVEGFELEHAMWKHGSEQAAR